MIISSRTICIQSCWAIIIFSFIGQAAKASSVGQDISNNDEKESQQWQKEHNIIANSISSYLQSYLKQDGNKSVKGAPAWFQKTKFSIPVSYNKYVKAYINYFSQNGRWFFEKWIRRSGRYFPMMKRILKQYGLPEDLVFLAMIESGLNMTAYSHAGAAGTWQFMRPTARQYGLHCSKSLDERMDIIKSTHAASQMLKYLYEKYQDWYLAWAAYNAGEGKVSRAIRRYKTDKYWKLIESGNYLATETKQYVPKIIAAAAVYKNYKRFKYKLPPMQNNLRLKKYRVPRNVSMRAIARHANLSYAALKEFNRFIRREYTPSHRSVFLYVPKVHGEKLKHAVAKVKRLHNKRMIVKTYRVKAGDNLYKIARKFSTSIHAIRDFNSIRGSHIYVGQKLKIRTTRPAKPRIYVVKSGDSLWKIATQFDVSVQALKRQNKLHSNHIYRGQRLRIQGKSANARRVVVRQGDTLWEIAKRNNTTVSKLLAHNSHIQAAHQLSVGTVLNVHPH